MNNRKKRLCFTLIMFATFALHGQAEELFPVITIVTQEDADNVDLRLFADNPDFTSEENRQIKRAVLDIALYTRGFDIGHDIWTLVDEEASEHYLNERRAAFFYRFGLESSVTDLLHPLREIWLQDFAFWITIDFMTRARREGGRLYLWVQMWTWPREHGDNLDANYGGSSWMELVFANVNGEYKLIHLFI